MNDTDRLIFDHTNRVLGFLESTTGLPAPPLSEAEFLALKAEVALLEAETHDLSECRCLQCRRFWREVLLQYRYGAR